MEIFIELRSLISKLQSQNFQPDEFRYLLKSFWVMACSETENILRTHIENEASKYSEENISQFHTNFLLRGFYDDEQNLTFKKVIEIGRDRSLIFQNNRFTDGFQGLSKKSIESILIIFGSLPSLDEKTILKKLYSFYQTRTSIVHTNVEDFSMTVGDLLSGLNDLEKAISVLKKLIKSK